MWPMASDVRLAAFAGILTPRGGDSRAEWAVEWIGLPSAALTARSEPAIGTGEVND
jgi:hypothetical protein